ncbi:MAG: hypothetical protein HYR66_11985 [Sphingobacteriales bacterium]|nr:hypothetical protein [Sphingobacteriales bacterium]MBI3720596.1 hypothetical protein [Sphingobacteriales bacterium]
MCNCGNKRSQYSNQTMTLSKSVVSDEITKQMWPDVKFEYTGLTTLTIIGSVTRKKYRFHHPNDVQVIDYRDASGMMGVGVLKKVKS